MIIDKSDWKPVMLGDVVIKREENDKENAKNRFERFLKVEHMDAGSLHLKRWANHSEEELPPTFYKIFRKGNILYPTRNPHLKRTAYASFDGICGEKTLTLEPIETHVVPDFLPFLFHSEAFYLHSSSSIIGSTNPHVRWRDIANYEFLLPPKVQQAKLSELLWSIDDVVQKNIRINAQLNQSRGYIFENLTCRAAGKQVLLKDVLIRKTSKSSPPHMIEKYIGLEHIDSGSFYPGRYGKSESAVAQCVKIEKGDLCYSKLRPYLDKSFIANFDAVGTTELLVYDTNKCSKEYLLNLFHSRPFLNYVSSRGFGTKMPRVNHKIIGEFSIKLLDDEGSVLKEMAKLNHLKERLEHKLNASSTLQKSIVNQVF